MVYKASLCSGIGNELRTGSAKPLNGSETSEMSITTNTHDLLPGLHGEGMCAPNSNRMDALARGNSNSSPPRLHAFARGESQNLTKIHSKGRSQVPGFDPQPISVVAALVDQTKE